jgi:hypothetical protein
MEAATVSYEIPLSSFLPWDMGFRGVDLDDPR